jgi:hypothetical protein
VCAGFGGGWCGGCRLGDVALPAGGRGVRGQKRMVAGPGWRVLAGWPGFLTG